MDLEMELFDFGKKFHFEMELLHFVIQLFELEGREVGRGEEMKEVNPRVFVRGKMALRWVMELFVVLLD